MFAQIDDRLNAILEKIKTFIEAEILPLEPLFLNHDFDALMPELEKRRNRVKKIGLWTPHLPKELGGLGLSLYQFGHVSEAMAYTPLGHYAFNCQAPDVSNTEILLEHATDEQKERFLKPLINGEIRSCFAMTEPEHAGSNPVYMSTSAEKDGDDYVINGHKWFTSAADGANFACVRGR